MSKPPLKDWVAKLKSSGVAKGIDEIHTLVRRDTQKAYSFYQQEGRAEAPIIPEKGVARYAAHAKAVFLSFLRKLSPARRIAYIASIAAFAWGFVQWDWTGAVVGFLILNVLLATELAEKLLTKDELEIARVIQFSLYPAGIGLGMQKGSRFGGLLEETHIDLAPGDVLLYYTDGISEAMNASDEPYGYDEMERVLLSSAHLSTNDIKERLLRSVDEFRRGTPFADDATLVVTKLK